MPNPQDLTPQQRIRRYRAEIDHHHEKHGYHNEFMLKVYKELLESAEKELAGIPLEQ